MKKSLLIFVMAVFFTASFAIPVMADGGMTTIDCGNGKGTNYLADSDEDARDFEDWWCKEN